jgi:hypothetical protein
MRSFYHSKKYNYFTDSPKRCDNYWLIDYASIMLDIADRQCTTQYWYHESIIVWNLFDPSRLSTVGCIKGEVIGCHYTGGVSLFLFQDQLWWLGSNLEPFRFRASTLNTRSPSWTQIVATNLKIKVPLLRSREVPVSNLGPKTRYPGWEFPWFSSLHPSKCRSSTLN